MKNRAFEIKQTRGAILSALREYYPNGLSAKTIHLRILAPVYQDINQEEANAYLMYLRGRDLVEEVKSEAIIPDDFQSRVFRVTPSGLDVANGVTADPSIILEA